MKSLFLVLFLLSQCLFQNTFDVVGPLSATAFQCLHQYYFIVIVRVYSLDNGGSIDPHSLLTLQNAKSVGYCCMDAYMVICRNNDPISPIRQIFSNLNPTGWTFAKLWIKVEPNTTPGCQWQSYSQTDNCDFLTAALNQVMTANPPVYGTGGAGVFTTAPFWEKNFGSTCNSIAQQYLLWSADYNASGQITGNFKSIGGWTSPFFVQTAGNVTVGVCPQNNLGWHAFIDQNNYYG